MNSTEQLLSLTRKVVALEGRVQSAKQEMETAERELQAAKKEFEAAARGILPSQDGQDDPENMSLRDRILKSLSRKAKRTQELIEDLANDSEVKPASISSYLTRLKNERKVIRGDDGFWSIEN